LNEKARRQEKAENEARAAARKKERSSRRPPVETQFEITLKNASQAGLPKPLSAVTRSPHVDASDIDSESPSSVPEEKDLASDSILEETQHILRDYIRLSNAPANTTLAHQTSR